MTGRSVFEESTFVTIPEWQAAAAWPPRMPSGQRGQQVLRPTTGVSQARVAGQGGQMEVITERCIRLAETSSSDFILVEMEPLGSFKLCVRESARACVCVWGGGMCMCVRARLCVGRVVGKMPLVLFEEDAGFWVKSGCGEGQHSSREPLQHNALLLV